MALQVVISAKRLRTLVALEGTLRLLLRLAVVAVDERMAAVRLLHAHARNHSHLRTWLMNIGHDGSVHRLRHMLIGAVRSIGPGRWTHGMRRLA